MKTLYSLLLLIAISFVVFVARDDLASSYTKGISYLDNKVVALWKNSKEITSNPNVKITEDINAINSKVENPGPLRVVSDIINSSNDTKVKLSTKNIIDITNRQRKENGDLVMLKENRKLDISAQIKVDDMLSKQYFEHTSPDGTKVADLADHISYEYITIGENLALGNFASDEELVKAWMDSKGHRENILNKNYTEIGVAVGYGEFEGRKTWLAVTHFGLPKSACPEIDEVLRGIISIDQEEVNNMKNDLDIRMKKISDRVVYENLTVDEQIVKYNNIVEDYNNLIKKLKNNIDKYNKQIHDFNDCIAVHSS